MTDETAKSNQSGQRTAVLRRLLLGGMLTGGLFAAALALWNSLVSAGDQVLPEATRWVIAAPFAALWLYSAVEAWIALFEAPGQRQTLSGALILSQLGKYVPGGGIIQVTSMVAMSRNEQVSTSRLALGLPVVGLSVVASGGVALALTAIVDTTIPGWCRPLFLLGFLSPVVLWRPAMAATIRTVRRFVSRTPSPDDLPSQGAILVSGTWAAASLVATAAAYAALLQPSYPESNLISLTLAFMVAWTAGFLVIPLPGGIGVREAVLVWIVGGSATTVVGAALSHRIITIGIELLAVVLHLLRRRLDPERRSPS